MKICLDYMKYLLDIHIKIIMGNKISYTLN